MRPFCLGHHLLLRSLGLPFAGCSDADCSPDEIIPGVVLCGLTHAEGLEVLNTPGKLEKLVRQWRRRVIGGFWIKGRPDMLDIEATFRDYLRDGYKVPPCWSYPGSGITLSAPWEVMLKTKLLQFGLSESEILAGYLPARQYEYASALEWEAAAACENPKLWRRMFWTREDSERWAESEVEDA